jgi:hypothetical protein
MVVILVAVAVIVTVHPHDIALVHHSAVEDFQVDDEVDDDEEEVGNYFLLFS